MFTSSRRESRTTMDSSIQLATFIENLEEVLQRPLKLEPQPIDNPDHQYRVVTHINDRLRQKHTYPRSKTAEVVDKASTLREQEHARFCEEYTRAKLVVDPLVIPTLGTTSTQSYAQKAANFEAIVANLPLQAEHNFRGYEIARRKLITAAKKLKAKRVKRVYLTHLRMQLESVPASPLNHQRHEELDSDEEDDAVQRTSPGTVYNQAMRFHLKSQKLLSHVHKN